MKALPVAVLAATMLAGCEVPPMLDVPMEPPTVTVPTFDVLVGCAQGFDCTDPDPVPPCPSEDGEQLDRCIWVASVRGNHVGQSFYGPGGYQPTVDVFVFADGTFREIVFDARSDARPTCDYYGPESVECSDAVDVHQAEQARIERGSSDD